MRKLIITVVLLLVFGAGFLLLSRPQASQQTKTNITPSETTTTQEKKTLNGLARSLELQPTLHEYDYMDWFENPEQPLPLRGEQFIVGTIDLNGTGKYGTFDTDDLKKITLANLAPLLKTSETYFRENGFTKNPVTTRTVSVPPLKTAFFGYEKGPLKCVIRIDEQTDPFGNFVCGIIDTHQETLQQEFRSLFFGPYAAKTIGDDTPITSFRIQKVADNFALGSANGNFNGYTWIAKKTNGMWRIVWRGNEIALCSDMEKAGVPESIYGSCYSD